jgi:hypothetical protein
MYDTDLQNIGRTVQELCSWAIMVIQMDTFNGTTAAHE